MLENGRDLSPQVYPIPAELDEKVGLLLLQSKDKQIDSLTPEQNYYINHWEI
jgi:adenosylhomocysteinase